MSKRIWMYQKADITLHQQRSKTPEQLKDDHPAQHQRYNSKRYDQTYAWS